jgi:CDP-glycerol glycerophosphotransferase (TagB/SpsB family)
MVGMPKVDCLVDGSLRRDAVLTALGLSSARPTVLYAPTWSPASSLNRFGLSLVRQLAQLPLNVIVKLHDRSRDTRARYSGGVDWPAALSACLVPGRVLLACEADVCPYLAASDVLITDHSSAGFEYLLLDRPLVRIHVPELIQTANIHRDYVELLSEVSESVETVQAAAEAVERALGSPREKSATRRAVAAELFHDPGGATARCAAELYDALELTVPAHGAQAAAPKALAPFDRVAVAGSACRPSA